MKKVLEKNAVVEIKECPSFPGYRATSEGKVISPKGKILRAAISNKGYQRAMIRHEYGFKSTTIHSVIDDAFIGPRPYGMQIRHLYDNKMNNKPSNLAYGTNVLGGVR